MYRNNNSFIQIHRCVELEKKTPILTYDPLVLNSIEVNDDTYYEISVNGENRYNHDLILKIKCYNPSTCGFKLHAIFKQKYTEMERTFSQKEKGTLLFRGHLSAMIFDITNIVLYQWNNLSTIDKEEDMIKQLIQIEYIGWSDERKKKFDEKI